MGALVTRIGSLCPRKNLPALRLWRRLDAVRGLSVEQGHIKSEFSSMHVHVDAHCERGVFQSGMFGGSSAHIQLLANGIQRGRTLSSRLSPGLHRAEDRYLGH